MRQVTSYRVKFDVVKPGGHVEHEDLSVRGGESELFAFLTAENPQGSYCLVFEYRGSDSVGVDVTDEYGWRVGADVDSLLSSLPPGIYVGYFFDYDVTKNV